MKRTLLIALAILASASFGTIEAKKKKEKKANKVEATQCAPVVLKSGSDTLSYVSGKAMTNGLLPYLKQSFGVDESQMTSFLRGFTDMVKAQKDSAMSAYAAGISIGQQLTTRMLPNLQNMYTDAPDTIITDVLVRGFVDALLGDTTVFTQSKAESLARELSEANKKAKDEKLYGPNREAGRKFLAENAKKDSVVVLPSGLQYKVLVKGNGAIPKRTDKVEVHYEGKLVDGTVFDSSSKHGSKPLSFRADQVIKGWTEALTMMPVGSKWQLFIPYELAYGEQNKGTIKPFSALIFTVELVGIEGQKAAADKAEAKPDTKTAAKTATKRASKAKTAAKPAAKK